MSGLPAFSAASERPLSSSAQRRCGCLSSRFPFGSASSRMGRGSGCIAAPTWSSRSRLRSLSRSSWSASLRDAPSASTEPATDGMRARPAPTPSTPPTAAGRATALDGAVRRDDRREGGRKPPRPIPLTGTARLHGFAVP